MKLQEMVVAGVMSGTSADGIDVALVQILPPRGQPKLTLLAHEAFPYPAVLRSAVLGAMNSAKISTAELARLNWRLGVAYAEAVRETVNRHKLKIDLIGCHGQTLYHQAATERYAGKGFACTWQAGEASVIAGATGTPVVSNFRPADMVAGGQGAPLVSLLDRVWFADAKRGRVLQNIGGIANLTAIPAADSKGQIVAFDTGPGNMIIDALVQRLFGKKYDRNGAIASRGAVLESVLSRCLGARYFKLKPPRTAGREQFGTDYAEGFLKLCRQYSRGPEDAVATATAFTAASIAQSFALFVAARMKGAPIDYIVSGGGAKNVTLMRMLGDRLVLHEGKLTTSVEFGLPAEAKEAAAFALMAWMTWHHRPGNVPAATGAKRPVILGQVTYAP